VDPERYVSFRGLKINGDIQLPAYFLPNYLALKPGNPYSRDRLLRIKDQLNSLLFIESTANPTVTFAGNDATVNLFLQKKKASRFDFIIGILPQPQDAGQVLLTGSLSAAFQNALSLGERFSIELDRLRPETQKLDVQGSIPYLFGTVFGADGKLNIFKRDSTWVDTHGELGAQYLLSKGNYFRFFWENRSAALLKIDTASIISTKRLPANLDLSQNGFGLESAFSQLDYRFNPRKGWLVNLKGSAGFNQVLRNSVIEGLTDPQKPEYRFSTLYDSLSQRSSRFRLETRAECYIPVFVRSTVKLSFRGGGIFSNQPVFANEQYRVGGNKLLRGFNEESLQATRFAVATAEWRLLIGRNSFMGVFTDWGYIENITSRNRIFLRPAGFGAGLNFETPTGIFGINVAAGRPDTGQAFDFRALKFHLGYVSLI
jgi:outer membrane protein assembly factor BamA